VELTNGEMPPHGHGEAGRHKHTFKASDQGWAFSSLGRRGDPRKQHGKAFGDVPTVEAGKHTHPNAGGGQPHENRPPFFVLAYIIYKG
jgi:microcystin-dependent protein